MNEPLINLRKQLDQKEVLCRKYCKDPYIRGSFFSALKFFLGRLERNDIKNTDSRLYLVLIHYMTKTQRHIGLCWKSWKKKKDDKDGNTNPVSDDTWYNYFKDLNISKTTRLHNPSVDAELPGLEKLKIFAELDYKISANEIYSAIGIKNNNKICGLVSLLNEMLKCSLHTPWPGQNAS